MPRGTARKKAPEIVDVPDEMLGFPERLVEARTMLKAQPSEFGTSRLERGIRVRGVTALTVMRIAAKMGVRVAWLLTGEEPKWLPGRQPSPDTSAPALFEEREE
jgi:hypothetical protein